MDFDQAAPKKKMSKMVSVKLNQETGQVEGWDSLFSLLEQESKDHAEKEAAQIRDEINARSGADL